MLLMRINFQGNLQRCETCHDWIVSSHGQPPVEACPYCGAPQRIQEAQGEKGLRVKVKSKGDQVSKKDAALISVRLQQFRMKAALALASGKTRQSGAQGTGSTDPYPAPEGDFTPTLSDVVNDHVMLGSLALIGVDIAFAWFGLLPHISVLEVIAGIVAMGTIVDTWVHKFFH
jgi:hypothetical protein